MTGHGRARRLAERLGPRDLAVLDSLRELRLMTGEQLGRLHVPGPHPVTQGRKTRAMMQRLSELGAVVRLRRRVGGVRAGSAGHVYGLSGLGQAVIDLSQQVSRRHRRVVETKPAFANHTLAVSGLYVDLVQHCQAGQAELLAWAAEPACWRRFPGAAGQTITLKPDAYIRLGLGEYELTAFVEVDLDSESLPTIARKLSVYIAYWHSGIEQHRWGVFPRIWWFAPTLARCEAIARTIQRLPAEAHALFAVGLLSEAAQLLTQHPAEGGAR
jgi:hypothetical protein